VADRTVSFTHALLTYDGNAWMLEDAGSTNGTFLNGWRITEPILVRPGDELTIGETTFMLALPRA
jgi:pSer/pThr/pTyr-binding forkhead associated (FHA) protein